MNTYVNTIAGEIPRDLLEQSQVVLALDNIAEIDADMLAMLPPYEISQLVLMERSEKEDERLGEWILEQQALWIEVEELSKQLPVVHDREDIPAWRAESWGMAITSKWGAGLSGAVELAREWLKS